MGLEFYKKGQGYYTRMCSAIAAGVISVLGCYRLYEKLDMIGVGETITPALKTWLRAGIPAVLFLFLSWLLLKLLNSPRCADFMIATEGEMKKVSWSSRKEIISSTVVVIITVAVMALLLMAVDLGFSYLFYEIGVLKVFKLS